MAADADDERKRPSQAVAISAGVGGVNVFVASIRARATTLVGSALPSDLGSMLAQGLQAAFAHKHRVVPALIPIASLFAGITVAIFLLPANPSTAGSQESGAPRASITRSTPTSPPTPLQVISSTMRFGLVSTAETLDDTDGLIGIAKITEGDPQRLNISRMHCIDRSSPNMGSAVVEVFAASTAIALSDLECQWFAAGHSGDAHTAPVTAGGVHCPFHGQGDGTDRAECWHWDEKMALVTFRIRTSSSADRYLEAGVADMFKQQESANEL